MVVLSDKLALKTKNALLEKYKKNGNKRKLFLDLLLQILRNNSELLFFQKRAIGNFTFKMKAARDDFFFKTWYKTIEFNSSKILYQTSS